MAHLLHRLGVSALLPRKEGSRVLPPLIGLKDALKLREEYYKSGKTWPYEDVVPGPPRAPWGCESYMERKKTAEQKRTARAKEIAEAMAAMPKLVAEYRARHRLDWSEVSDLDRLLLNHRQIRDKYVKRRLTKQQG